LLLANEQFFLQIIWDNRFLGNTPYRAKITVDGTDFRIRQPTVSRKQYYSHKYKDAGLRYEVGICIATGHIVWINGPFPCGANPDITIFRKSMKWSLKWGERVEADAGYRGEPLFVSIPEDYSSQQHKTAKDHARSRHEQINRRLKNFQILHQIFRHDRDKHVTALWAVAVVTQMSICLNEKTVWPVEYIGELYQA
jgi:DDE superfamily endonuclease